ncbi:hypothetical protein [Crenobacter caeni]|uniref:hypothetical protein n=1 Tax=Crenobacter caeni TaxID=2705474 RepID=UPI0013D0F662|nr:hypothetical protein [Crenobacter caeni]
MAAERHDPLTFEPDIDNLAAFRLLAHAEFEDYLETKARDGLTSIETAFSNNQKVSGNVSLLVIAISLSKSLRLESPHWSSDVTELLRTARDWINKNNGIKDASFTMLSVFSGKMPDEVDGALSASLSAYGTSRGDVAHKSATRVTTIQAPSVEARAVDALIDELDDYFG